MSKEWRGLNKPREIERGRGVVEHTRDETRLVEPLILILATRRTCCSSSNAGVESSWWIFAASVPLLALIARSRLLSWCDLGLGADALNLSMAAEDACESNGSVRRSGKASIVGVDSSDGVHLEPLCILCKHGFYPSRLRGS